MLQTSKNQQPEVRGKGGYAAHPWCYSARTPPRFKLSRTNTRGSGVTRQLRCLLNRAGVRDNLSRVNNRDDNGCGEPVKHLVTLFARCASKGAVHHAAAL